MMKGAEKDRGQIKELHFACADNFFSNKSRTSPTVGAIIP